MILMLDERQALAACTSDIAEPRRRRSHARTLARLGFLPSLATPRFAAPAPIRPNRRRDQTSSEWHPL